MSDEFEVDTKKIVIPDKNGENLEIETETIDGKIFYNPTNEQHGNTLESNVEITRLDFFTKLVYILKILGIEYSELFPENGNQDAINNYVISLTPIVTELLIRDRTEPDWWETHRTEDSSIDPFKEYAEEHGLLEYLGGAPLPDPGKGGTRKRIKKTRKIKKSKRKTRKIKGGIRIVPAALITLLTLYGLRGSMASWSRVHQTTDQFFSEMKAARDLPADKAIGAWNMYGTCSPLAMGYAKLITKDLFSAGVIQRGILESQKLGLPGYSTDSRSIHPGNLIGSTAVYQQEFYSTSVELKDPGPDKVKNTQALIDATIQTLHDQYSQTHTGQKDPNDKITTQLTIPGHSITLVYSPFYEDGIIVEVNNIAYNGLLKPGIKNNKELNFLPMHYIPSKKSGANGRTPLLKGLEKYYDIEEGATIPLAVRYLENKYGVGGKDTSYLSILGSVPIDNLKINIDGNKPIKLGPSLETEKYVQGINAENPNGKISTITGSRVSYTDKNKNLFSIETSGAKPDNLISVPLKDLEAATISAIAEQHGNLNVEIGFHNINGSNLQLMKEIYTKSLANNGNYGLYNFDTTKGSIERFHDKEYVMNFTEVCNYAKKAGINVPACTATDPSIARGRYDKEAAKNPLPKKAPIVSVVDDKKPPPPPPAKPATPHPPAKPAQAKPATPPPPAKPAQAKPATPPPPIKPVQAKPATPPPPVKPVQAKPATPPPPAKPAQAQPAQTPEQARARGKVEAEKLKSVNQKVYKPDVSPREQAKGRVNLQNQQKPRSWGDWLSGAGFSK